MKIQIVHISNQKGRGDLLLYLSCLVSGFMFLFEFGTILDAFSSLSLSLSLCPHIFCSLPDLCIIGSLFPFS